MGRCGSVVILRMTGDQGVMGANPGVAASELWQFLCQCLSEETLKAVGPFHPVSKK